MENPSLNATMLVVDDGNWLELAAVARNVAEYLRPRRTEGGMAGVACEAIPLLECESSDALGTASPQAPTLPRAEQSKDTSLELELKAADTIIAGVGAASAASPDEPPADLM